MTSLPFPAPVHFGVVTTGGEHAQLHKYTVERNLNKIERLLKRGVDVDCVNHLGQTPLFCAALWGQVKLTDLLLDYGADPNHRCEDCSTPVHAGVFSCNPLVVSSLLDAGGDLRLHDQEGRSPFDWLRSAPQEGRTRMEDFLQGCMSSMQQLFQSPDMMNICFSAPYRQPPACYSPCLYWIVLNHVTCCSTRRQTAGVPLQQLSVWALERHSWRGSKVTVKSLRDSQTEHLDLLLTELQYCSQLSHPQLLQLMAVSVSDDLLRTSLVFEQVDVGTLHSLLHNKRAEFPVLQEGWILSVMLQVCEGLHFLHRGALVMRALSSHSVILTKLTVAKLSCLGFMVPSSETSCVKPPPPMALPPSLHRWAAPEVIKQRPCREEADIYSVCALILELYTDDEPWGTLDPVEIKQAMDSGQALSVNSVPQPYYELVSTGLQLEPQNRTCSLQTLTNTLQQDIKRLGMDEQPRVNISAYPEPDPECGVQTRTQQTTVKEQVHSEKINQSNCNLSPSAVCRALRPVTPKASPEEERHEVPLYKQLDRRPQSEPDRERDKCSAGEPMLHHPHTLILPLLSESDSSSDDEEPDSVTDDEEPDSVTYDEEPDADMETVEQLVGLRQPKINQQTSTISLNLKVSRELLQEAHRSLDTVENHCQLVQRNATPCIHDNTSCDPFFSMSSEDPCGVTAAVGPPSEWYSFSPHGRDDWTENLVFQLLSRDFKLLSEEELSLWLSHYPADQTQCEQRGSLPGLSTGEADQCSEQLSQYVSALDDSDLNIMSDRKQQTSRSEEDADVSVEVCRPASTGNLLVDTQNTSKT
ncbi:LOW QUALITY PROTEIN: inactive serine/threonine-protein kinase TEX14 [Tautogolabrus adspersus]